MVAIFGAALLLPFPKGRLAEDAAVTEAVGLPDDGSARLVDGPAPVPRS